VRIVSLTIAKDEDLVLRDILPSLVELYNLELGDLKSRDSSPSPKDSPKPRP
jgi:hypothetical protein